jgi:hypothetical protein
MLRKVLLVCGILSSLLYLGIDALAAIRYGAYHSYTSQAISELGAVGAPTKDFVEPLFLAYDLLIIGFGVGVWASARGRRVFNVIGGLLIGVGLIGFVTPPMNLRGTAEVSGDLAHILFTAVIVLFIVSAIATGASLYGRNWRRYSFATIGSILISGAVTGLAARQLAAGQPTPWLGVAERINIGAYLLWVALLGWTLVRSRTPQARIEPNSRFVGGPAESRARSLQKP